MRFSYDPEAGAFYLHVTEDDVAKTKELVDSELLVDYDARGRLVGVEVLELRHLARIPEILAQHGVDVPERIHFDKLADALASVAA